MSATYHLISRNGVWYYRRRVPTALVEAFGKKFIQHSLQTSSLKEAKKRRSAEDLKWSTQFEAAEQKPSTAMSVAPPKPGLPLSEAEVIRLVQDYVERADHRARTSSLNDPPESEEQRAEIRTDIEIGLSIVQNRDDPRADEWTYSVAQKLLQPIGKAADDADLPHPAFTELVRRAITELDRRRLARINDSHGQEFFDQLFNPTRPRSLTFKELTDQYLQLTADEARANRTSQKWIDKQLAIVGLLREIIGDETPVAGIGYDECMRVRGVLARTPSNRSKAYGKLSLEQAIQKAGAENKRLLSATTQQQYLSALRDALDLAARKRVIPSNPAESLRPLRRDTIAAGDKRRPFTPEQIRQIFDSKYYRQAAKSSPPYKYDPLGWRFWLPLMCLFMGLRPNEAAQMHAGDLKRTDQGTWFLEIVETADDDEANLPGAAKTLKTATSERKIPLHPELIAIGFLQFVRIERKKATALACFRI